MTATSARSEALTDPVEITARAWHQAFNTARITFHCNDSFGETFKTTDRGISAVYVRVNDRHLTFQVDADMPHAACIRHALSLPLAHRIRREDHER